MRSISGRWRDQVEVSIVHEELVEVGDPGDPISDLVAASRKPGLSPVFYLEHQFGTVKELVDVVFPGHETKLDDFGTPVAQFEVAP